MSSGDQGMDPVDAHEVLLDFARRHGKAALELAMHVAPAQRFGRELLHLVRLNFVSYPGADAITESDVLLAPFCHEVGSGHYRFDPEVGSQLQDHLGIEYANDREPRVRRVAQFLAAYVEHAGRIGESSKDAMSREYFALLSWVALAHTQPSLAAEQLAKALNEAIDRRDSLLRLQISTVVGKLTLPLLKHQRLLAYAAGMEALEASRTDDAVRLLTPLEGVEVAPGVVARPLQQISKMLRPPTPVKTRRFRVAFSFPGEHRARVERIAEAVARRLGRDRVLYDKWFSAEFARPNLDVYLSRLYHDESDLIVVFLAKEYAAKEWSGLEWRTLLDVLKRNEDDRVMVLRLDDGDLPGLYSIDGYLDIRDMADGEVADAIFRRLGETPQKPHRAFTAKLPVVYPTLIGREEELAFLDRAWANPATNFVQVIAAGGTGKTALVDKWFRRHLGEATVFGWSFYSQGTSDDRQTSSDLFFADILAWLHIEIPPTASIYTKAEAVANRLREERVLLILDGVEPLQDAGGAVRDAALKALLLELDTSNRGLVVCTTRVRMDIPDDAPRVLSIDLDNLTPEQGAEYLRSLRVEGTDEELRQASHEYGNHVLALTLLGTYLMDFCGGDIRRRVEIRDLLAEETRQGAHARRAIAAYARLFEGKPELHILRALGYFDRPAEPTALRVVLPRIEDRKYRAALKRLQDSRLILTADPEQPLDCHPLVREYFSAEATREGHQRLYKYYAKQAPQWPDTLEQMTPLFYAVYHGCRADRHTECLRDIYRDRILRSNQAYLTRQLGALATDLSLLANFFETPWTQPVPALTAADQSWMLNEAGFALRSVGRLADAVEPMRVGTEGSVASMNWRDAATGYSNLSDIHLSLGNVPEAVAAARQAVDLADRNNDAFLRTASRADLAHTLHQSGDFVEAMRLFGEGERLQAESRPEYPILDSSRGYQYCDLLLDQGQTAEVLHRASQTLLIAERTRWLLDIGLNHLSLGRAHSSGSGEAAMHLDQAVDFLRRAGQLDKLPLALLARGTPRDLDEAYRIATRSGMRLCLADYHLARGNLAEAKRLIKETGYHRRDGELAGLHAKLAR